MRAEKKFGDRKRDSVSVASGSRSVNPRAKRVGPDRSRLVSFTLDYTRLARSKTNREPVRRLEIGTSGSRNKRHKPLAYAKVEPLFFEGAGEVISKYEKPAHKSC